MNMETRVDQMLSEQEHTNFKAWIFNLLRANRTPSDATGSFTLYRLWCHQFRRQYYYWVADKSAMIDLCAQLSVLDIKVIPLK